jgi:hypothetical protein
MDLNRQRPLASVHEEHPLARPVKKEWWKEKEEGERPPRVWCSMVPASRFTLLMIVVV